MPHATAIDGFEFARNRSRLAGTRSVGEFSRLREVLRAPEGVLNYEVQGVPEAQGRPALQLTVSGRLALLCQRCLGPLDFSLQTKVLLLLYDDEAELAARSIDADGPECIVAGRDMPVLELIEDEVLLAIPYAPRHERCGPRSRDGRAETQRPFAALRDLLDGKH